MNGPTKSFGWSVGSAVLTLILLPDTARPQRRSAEPVPVTLGNRVRVAAPAVVEGRLEGSLTALDEEFLNVSADGRLVRVSWDSVTRLDVSTGRPRQILKGAAIGAATLGAVAAVGCDGEASCLGGGILAGALWGGAIGVLFKGDRWTEVPLRASPAGSGAPALATEAAAPDTGDAARIFPAGPGSTVRLWAPTVAERRIRGTVLRVEEQSLSIRSGADLLSVSRDAITRLEVSTGRRRQVWKGLGIGAGVGAIVGGASGCFPMVGCGGDVDQHLGAALVGAVGFAGWGAIIGAFVQTERWQAIPLERVHVAVAPARGGGFGLRVAYSF